MTTETKALTTSNTLALLHLVVPVTIACGGLWMTLEGGSIIAWLAGQIALGIVFFQCFILLHETGHQSFFRSRLVNKALGHLFGFVSVIPYQSWEAIHALHHKWTGWRDKDPTTAGTVAAEFGPLVKGVVNIAWLVWFPLFTLGYRLGNYWSPGKLRRYLPPAKLKRIHLNQALLIAGYAIVAVVWGEWTLRNLGVAYLISLVISDLFILSQHSHIDIPLANGADVQPISYAKQVAYTRSLRINRLVARYVLLNFNLHELHHARPGIPAYHLGGLADEMPNTRPFLRYVARAKRMKGVDFVFSTTRKTGVEV
jgi:acyl-lipid omega-6 desaturase (Delta-12 desaturase)